MADISYQKDISVLGSNSCMSYFKFFIHKNAAFQPYTHQEPHSLLKRHAITRSQLCFTHTRKAPGTNVSNQQTVLDITIHLPVF